MNPSNLIEKEYLVPIDYSTDSRGLLSTLTRRDGIPVKGTTPLFSDRAFTLCCRQIHPLYGEKAGLLGYCDTVGNTENFPPAPNIVVEGGRIEFVRPSQDGTTTTRRSTMSRASQTFNEQPEKSDPAKVRGRETLKFSVILLAFQSDKMKPRNNI